MRRQSVPGHLSALEEWPGGEATSDGERDVICWSTLRAVSARNKVVLHCAKTVYITTILKIAISIYEEAHGSFHIISTTFWHDPLGFSRNLVLLNPTWSYDSITSLSLIPCMVSFKTLIAFSTIFPTTCCLTIYNFVLFCPISKLKTSH